MRYEINVSNRNPSKMEYIKDVKLENDTTIGSEIKWKDKNYRVLEIIINPEDELINLVCSAIRDRSKPIEITTNWN
jgi:hypothetical protein